MWNPTHVNVIVQRAENLLIKGKNGTNNSFIVIQLGKEVYRTSIKEKSGESVFWNEECDLKIPKVGNAAILELTAYHRNNLGLDQFLGSVRIPLVSFEKSQKITQWYRLQGKPGKEKRKDKPRGELEVQISLTAVLQSQSLTALQSKKNSLQKLTGSLFSLREKKIGVKKLAGNLTKTVMKKKKKKLETLNSTEDPNLGLTKQYNNLDPGVISDEEDSGSFRSSESLGNTDGCTTPPPKPKRTFTKNPEISVSQWDDSNLDKISDLSGSGNSIRSQEKPKPKPRHLLGRLGDRRLSISCVDFTHLVSPKPEKKFSSTLQLEGPGESHNKLSKLTKKFKNFHIQRKSMECPEFDCLSEEQISVPKEFKNKNKDELINMVVDLQKRVNCISIRVKDLEEYLDGILVKVMETVPKILEKS